ncbi:MAG: 50S ribosomal protein L23 [Bacteroidetes bacterium]|nr:50S ribosomal protein L23 [Bacteroidota bacterium]
MNGILIQPLLTEKMTELTSKRQYAFKVNPNANKISIAKAVEKKFNVNVTSVRTANVKGKVKSQMTKRGRIAGRRSDWKKAIVTLKDGQTIDFLANV